MVYIGTKGKTPSEGLSRIFLPGRGRSSQGCFANHCNWLEESGLPEFAWNECRVPSLIPAGRAQRRFTPVGGAVELRITRCGCNGD